MILRFAISYIGLGTPLHYKWHERFRLVWEVVMSENCCPKCGQPVSGQAAFCSTCGTRVELRKGIGLLKGLLIVLGLLFVVGIFTPRTKQSGDAPKPAQTGNPPGTDEPRPAAAAQTPTVFANVNLLQAAVFPVLPRADWDPYVPGRPDLGFLGVEEINLIPTKGLVPSTVNYCISGKVRETVDEAVIEATVMSPKDIPAAKTKVVAAATQWFRSIDSPLPTGLLPAIGAGKRFEATANGLSVEYVVFRRGKPVKQGTLRSDGSIATVDSKDYQPTAMALAVKQADKSWANECRDARGQATGPSTAPSTAPPKTPPKIRSADIGETFAMRRPAVCGDTPKALDEITKWLARDDDREEAARALLKYGGEIIGVGQSVKVLDRTGFVVQRSKIRILKTGHECWVAREFTD